METPLVVLYILALGRALSCLIQTDLIQISVEGTSVNIAVGVLVGVKVAVEVGGMTLGGARLGVAVRVGVFVPVGVFVGVRVKVEVAVKVGV